MDSNIFWEFGFKPNSLDFTPSHAAPPTKAPFPNNWNLKKAKQDETKRPTNRTNNNIDNAKNILHT